MSNEVMDFSNEEIQIVEVNFPPKISDKKHYLKPADGNAEIAHRRLMLSAAKIGSDGRPTQLGEDITKLAPTLVGMCLFCENNTNPVGMIWASKLPATLLAKLYEKATIISGIKKNEDRLTKEERIAKLKEELANLESLENEAKKD